MAGDRGRDTESDQVAAARGRLDVAILRATCLWAGYGGHDSRDVR